MRDDQMVLCLDGNLHVADDARLLVRGRHGAAVSIGARYLRLAGIVHPPLDGVERICFFPIVRELLDRPRQARLYGRHTRFSNYFVRAIEFCHIPLDGSINLAQTPLQLLAREALRPGLDGFELASVDGDNAGI
jgi:hypothetical protein